MLGNLYFVIFGIAVFAILLSAFLIRRRRRRLAKEHAINTRRSLQRDLAVISNSFHAIHPTRSHGTWDRPRAGARSGGWATESERYGGRRMSGRTFVSTTGHNRIRSDRDTDGLRLDVDESGHAPPPYMKETNGSIDKPPSVRARSMTSDDGTAQGGTTPGEVRGEIELHEIPSSPNGVRLPSYNELGGETPIRVPEPVHHPSQRDSSS